MKKKMQILQKKNIKATREIDRQWARDLPFQKWKTIKKARLASETTTTSHILSSKARYAKLRS